MLTVAINDSYTPLLLTIINGSIPYKSIHLVGQLPGDSLLWEDEVQEIDPVLGWYKGRPPAVSFALFTPIFLVQYHPSEVTSNT